MPCYHPLLAWRGKGVNPKTGKRSLVFKAGNALDPKDHQELPCGQCIGCRLERSRQWAMRCVHEASLYEDNCFITLTYDNDHLPEDLSLDKSHFQKFMKRLRKRYPDTTIRFFACGEYGEKYHRPHYHACLFNFDFEDKKLWKISNGNRLYTSEILANLWPFGYNVIGNVTFDSAAYVARYIMKKVNVSGATPSEYKKNYQSINDETGEITTIIPEFTLMSRRPGIGKDWYEKFKKDAYPSDFITVNGQKMKPPKYYDTHHEDYHPDEMENIKERRKHYAESFQSNNTAARLKAREKAKQLQTSSLIRPEQ